MSVRITDRDNGYEHLRFALRNIHGQSILIGVNEEPHEGSPGLTNADVGKFQEFGTRTIPARSFLRAWVDQQEGSWPPKISAAITQWLYRQVTGASWQAAFGEWAVGQVRARMRQHIPPPLAPQTVKRKGSDTPLIDTEQLIDAIEWQEDRSGNRLPP